MPLATVSQYIAGADFKDVTVAVNSNISMALNFATAAIEQLCQHNLEQQPYQYWFRSDLNYSDFFTNIEGYNTDFYVQGNRPQYNESYGANIIVLNQFPITKLAVFRSASAGSISTNSVAGNITISNTAMTVDSYDTSGNQTETVIDFTSNKTIGAVAANVASIGTGWNFQLNQGFENLPSTFLRQIYATVNMSNQALFAANPANPIAFTLENDRKLIFNDVVDEVLVNYSAGWVYPVDNSNNTAVVVQGNVPPALQQVCILVANDILAFIFPDSLTGINPRMLKSETLGDYKWERLDGMDFQNLVKKYLPLLQNYVLKSL